MEQQTPDISILILTRNEAASIAKLLPELARQMVAEERSYEVLVVDAHSADGTADVARAHGARVIPQVGNGYASALREGLAACMGTHIVTLDADMSHRAEVVKTMLMATRHADVVIASRYIRGGRADMRWDRLLLSIVLNRVFATALDLPLRDLSSGFRVYRRDVVETLISHGQHFDVLPELGALAHLQGFAVIEVPFHYRQREGGVSKARVFRFAPAYLRTLFRCWRCKRANLRTKGSDAR